MIKTSESVGTAFGFASGIGAAVVGAVIGGYVSDCKEALKYVSPVPTSRLIGAPAGFSRETCETFASFSSDTIFILTWVIALALFGITTAYIVVRARATEQGTGGSVPPPAAR